jgi:hypothetical protein
MSHDADFIARVLDLFKSGLSTGAIGVQLHVTRNTIAGIVSRAGVKRANHPSSAPKAKPQMRAAPSLPQAPLVPFAGKDDVRLTAAEHHALEASPSPRMNVVTGPKVTAAPVVRERSRQSVAASDRNLERAMQAKADSPPEPDAEPLSEEVPELVEGSNPVTIFDLRSHHCRFPTWPHYARPKTEQAFYCGAPKLRGAYCEHHANRVGPGWVR